MPTETTKPETNEKAVAAVKRWMIKHGYSTGGSDVGWYIAAPEKDAESDMSKPETTAPLDLLAQRVAMAICRVSCQSGLCEGGGRCWDWMPALPEARAAITAMERCKWESLIPK